jgi:hypothetical protein
MERFLINVNINDAKEVFEINKTEEAILKKAGNILWNSLISINLNTHPRGKEIGEEIKILEQILSILKYSSQKFS